MSGYDLGVWCSDVPITQEFAIEYYKRIGESWLSVGDALEFRSFFKELMAQYPNLGGHRDPLAHAGDVPDRLLRTVDGDDETTKPTSSLNDQLWSEVERSRWAATVTPLGCFAPLSVRWDYVVDVVPQIEALALKHGLVVFDPQENTVQLPANLRSRTPQSPRPILIVRISGKRPRIDMRVSFKGTEIVHEKLPSRRAAHRKARDLAARNGQRLYELEDPQTEGQEQPVSVSLDDPNAPDIIKDQIATARREGATDITLVRYRSGLFELKFKRRDGSQVVVAAVSPSR